MWFSFGKLENFLTSNRKEQKLGKFLTIGRKRIFKKLGKFLPNWESFYKIGKVYARKVFEPHCTNFPTTTIKTSTKSITLSTTSDNKSNTAVEESIFTTSASSTRLAYLSNTTNNASTTPKILTTTTANKNKTVLILSSHISSERHIGELKPV